MLRTVYIQKSVLIYDTMKILCACEEKFASIILSSLHDIVISKCKYKIYSIVEIVGFNLQLQSH